MKNKPKYTLLLICGILLLSLGSIAQPPPPPGNPSENNSLPVGSPGAPVGNGAGILILLGLVYGATKVRTGKGEELP